MNARRLRRLFEGAALVVLASPVACSGSGSGIDTTGFDLSVCDPDGYHPVRGLHPATAADYVSLRFASGTGGTAAAIDSDGTECAGAADQATCMAKANGLVINGGWGGNFGGAQRYLLVTRKDDAVVYASIPQLLSFLGPIDNAKEAALLATEAHDHSIVCKPNNARAVEGGFEVLTTSGSGCGTNDDIRNNVVRVGADGTFTIVQSEIVKPADPNCAIGRRPEGLGHCEDDGEAGLGTHLARIARLEAASVPAFTRLVRELRAHGAPRSLVARARRARLDEIRHARMMARLARRFGKKPQPIDPTPMHVRPLVDVARENMVEGCVREAFGALVATFQAEAAHDEEIAAAMRGIARDETEHAALSYAIARWADARLSRAERAEIEEARERAIATLRRELSEEPPKEAIARAGFPSRAQAEALFAHAASALFT